MMEVPTAIADIVRYAYFLGIVITVDLVLVGCLMLKKLLP